MSLLKYLKKKDGSLIPNPNGPLSEHLSPRGIEECNSRVSEITEKQTNTSSNKSPMRTPTRGKYAIYSSNDRAKIGQYAAENGPASATRKFTT
jgi:hypothetical protein